MLDEKGRHYFLMPNNITEGSKYKVIRKFGMISGETALYFMLKEYLADALSDPAAYRNILVQGTDGKPCLKLSLSDIKEMSFNSIGTIRTLIKNCVGIGVIGIEQSSLTGKTCYRIFEEDEIPPD